MAELAPKVFVLEEKLEDERGVIGIEVVSLKDSVFVWVGIPPSKLPIIECAFPASKYVWNGSSRKLTVYGRAQHHQLPHSLVTQLTLSQNLSQGKSVFVTVAFLRLSP